MIAAHQPRLLHTMIRARDLDAEGREVELLAAD